MYKPPRMFWRIALAAGAAAGLAFIIYTYVVAQNSHYTVQVLPGLRIGFQAHTLYFAEDAKKCPLAHLHDAEIDSRYAGRRQGRPLDSWKLPECTCTGYLPGLRDGYWQGIAVIQHDGAGTVAVADWILAPLLMMLMWPLANAMRIRARMARRRIQNRCGLCGYRMRDRATDRCPECGAAHRPLQSAVFERRIVRRRWIVAGVGLVMVGLWVASGFVALTGSVPFCSVVNVREGVVDVIWMIVPDRNEKFPRQFVRKPFRLSAARPELTAWGDGTRLIVPLWIPPAMVFGALAVGIGARTMVRFRRRRDGLCLVCAATLAPGGDRCVECDQPVRAAAR